MVMTNDLNSERNRLCNRLRKQPWRYFPAMLEFEQDLGAEWFLGLWELVPIPDNEMRIREASIARIPEKPTHSRPHGRRSDDDSE
jgi:transposase